MNLSKHKNEDEHVHKTMTKSLECIVMEWAVLRTTNGFDTEKARKFQELLQNTQNSLQELIAD